MLDRGMQFDKGIQLLMHNDRVELVPRESRLGDCPKNNMTFTAFSRNMALNEKVAASPFHDKNLELGNQHVKPRK